MGSVCIVLSKKGYSQVLALTRLGMISEEQNPILEKNQLLIIPRFLSASNKE